MKHFLNSKIAANLFSLTSAEIAKRLLGFFTLVYLGRTLNSTGFGIIGFAAAIISYFILIVNFGFNNYATVEIAKDTSKIQTYVNNILSIRIFLSIILTAVLIVYLLYSEKTLETKYVILITGITVYAHAIALNWVFQAVEKMQIIAIRQVMGGLLSLIGVLLFVKTPNDVIVASIIISLSLLLGNTWFIPIYQKMYGKIKFEFDLRFWKELIQKSFPLAYAAVMIGVYYNLDLVMLGYMQSESDVGIFNAAFKVFLLGTLPFQLIFTSFFPSLSRVGLINSREFRTLLTNFGKTVIGTGLLSGTIILLFSDRIIFIIFGENYHNSVLPLSILAVNIVVIGFNVFLGNPLIAWGKNKEYSIAITAGAVTNIVLNFILIPKYNYVGAALATLASELAVFIGVFYLFKKFTLGLFSSKNNEV
ncbi:MAG: flippase [Ignavibacteriaceae bacterium]|nr:flippase [Ignavibacteriaceae bacterium]